MFPGNSRCLILLFTVSCLMFADMAMAQPGRGRGGPGGRGGFFQASSIELLRDEKVQAELDMVDEQVESIMEIVEEMNEAREEFFNDVRTRMRELDEEGRREMFSNLREEVTTMFKKFNDRAEEELLPVQLDRLKQLVVRAEMQRSGGPERGSISPKLAEELGLTEEQQQKIKEKAEKVAPELQEKIAKLRADAVNDILSSVLDSEQMARYKELVGDEFQFSNRGRGGFGGPGGPPERGDRGDRGDRGGRRRGGRPGADGGNDFN